MCEEKAGTSACLLSNVEHDDDSDSEEELEISDSMSGCSEEDAECEEVVVQDEVLDLDLLCLVNPFTAKFTWDLYS